MILLHEMGKTILTSLLPQFQNILDQTQQTTTVVVIMLFLEKRRCIQTYTPMQ